MLVFNLVIILRFFSIFFMWRIVWDVGMINADDESYRCSINMLNILIV
jgi:hypothetical protein